jgi:2-polyprenyl-3-methyl-5-hydroxy-6-metoxy-1,4-benzoquinol methylase
MTPLPRVRAPELMDRPDVDPDEHRTSLADLRFANRWLGGGRSAVRLVLAAARRVEERPVRVLDVGTGGADIPIALARAARRAGLELRITATDVHPAAVETARRATADEPWIEVGEADALALPWDDGAFHAAMGCTMLHHFSRSDAVRIVAELGRVAGHTVVVTDLERSRLVLLGVRLLAATLWRHHPVTRHDGPVSVRAAFTARELEEIAREALGGGVVRRDVFFRLSLVIDRTEARER